MDTVETPLTDAWIDLTAIWSAATPPAGDGEVVTVQPGDQGASQAIVVAQGVDEPSGRDGHVVSAGDDVLHCTMGTGRKHWGRAYMGSARIVATGTGAR